MKIYSNQKCAEAQGEPAVCLPVQSARYALDSSITWGTYSLTVNVSYMCVREDRDTAVREINSNHRTICMVWQDGMWQVDDIAFLSDDDFAAHKYADLNK